MTVEEIKQIFGDKSVKFKKNIIVIYPGLSTSWVQAKKLLEYDIRDMSFTLTDFSGSFMYWFANNIINVKVTNTQFIMKLSNDTEVIFDKLPGM